MSTNGIPNASRFDLWATVPISEIRADDWSPTTIYPEALARISASLLTHGFVKAVIVYADPNFPGYYTTADLDSEVLWRAARSAGFTEVPCAVLRGYTREQVVQCMLRISARGEAKADEVQRMISQMQESGWVEAETESK